MENFGWTIDDKSPTFTGAVPTVKSLEGHIMPMAIKHGLPYLCMRPYTNTEYDELPHILATSPTPWDPTCLDHAVPSNWYDSQPPSSPYSLDLDYDAFGRLKAYQSLLDQDDPDEPDDGVFRHDVWTYASNLVSSELRSARKAFALTRKQRQTPVTRLRFARPAHPFISYA